MRSICRPTINQRSFFNGHKRTHAIKFQSVVVPDGLVMHLSGPYPGLMHDAAMLRFSGLLVDMETSLVDDDDTDFILYGDAGYPITSQLLVPYKEIHPTEEQVEFNRQMSGHRIIVEWAFGQVLANFAFTDFKKNIRLYSQRPGQVYAAAMLLNNCKICLRGTSAAAQKYALPPPTIGEYLY